MMIEGRLPSIHSMLLIPPLSLMRLLLLAGWTLARIFLLFHNVLILASVERFAYGRQRRHWLHRHFPALMIVPGLPALMRRICGLLFHDALHSIGDNKNWIHRHINSSSSVVKREHGCHSGARIETVK
jgi:hypothetical protein